MNAARQFVRRRLCCCCYNDAAKFGDQPVVLTRAETVTTQPTSSGTTSLNRLSVGDASEKGSNGTALRPNGGAHANSAYSGSIGGDFDEIDLGERGRRDELVLHVPGDRVKRSTHYAQSGQQQPAEGNDDQVVSGVVDMMLDDIYEEKSDDEEQASPVVETNVDLDANAVSEATDEEVLAVMNKPRSKPPTPQKPTTVDLDRLELDLSPRSPSIVSGISASGRSSSERRSEGAEVTPPKPPRTSLRHPGPADESERRSNPSNASVDTIISGQVVHKSGEVQAVEVAPAFDSDDDLVESAPVENGDVEGKVGVSELDSVRQKRRSLQDDALPTPSPLAAAMRPPPLPEKPVPRKRSPMRRPEQSPPVPAPKPKPQEVQAVRESEIAAESDVSPTVIRVNGSPMAANKTTRMYADVTSSSDSSSSGSSDSESDDSPKKRKRDRSATMIKKSPEPHRHQQESDTEEPPSSAGTDVATKRQGYVGLLEEDNSESTIL